MTFYSKLGQAYRSERPHARRSSTPSATTRTRSTNVERPWIRHTTTKTIGEGDYDKLIAVLHEAFGGTGQPLPGEGGVAIWYMEQGFQTTIRPAKGPSLPRQRDDRQVLPPFFARGAAGRPRGRAPDQATQLADALQFAYCQPAVGAFFNFELTDEPILGGWQSGLLWADRRRSRRTSRSRRRSAASRQGGSTARGTRRLSAGPGPRSASRGRRRGAEERPPEPSSSVPADDRALAREAEAFTTADGSTIRELLGLPTAPVRNQSLAEATLESGQETQRHYHARGGGDLLRRRGLRRDGAGRRDRRTVAVGDAVLIPPGAWHEIRADDAAAPVPLLLRARVPARGHLLRLAGLPRCHASRSACR